MKVTAAHIERGRPISYTYGPIAHAVRDRVMDGTLVQLVHGTLFVCRCGRRYWLDLPPHALQFTRRFNAHESVAPFAFRIRLPADLLQARSTRPRRRPPEIATLSHGRDRRSVA